MQLAEDVNTHVLFIHGVGTHSRLATLVRPYQSLRADPRSHEAPTRAEDPIPGWKLSEFSEPGNDEALTCLTLRHVAEPGSVHLYEVNYSALAGVVRQNQRLDLTALFVGFDLAVSVARTRLQNDPPGGSASAVQLGLAQCAQRMASVLVAATVPVLGLPSLVFRRFTQSFVAVYTRFFEDIATFTLDRTGNELVAAHVQGTVQRILESPRFCRRPPDGQPDRLVIVAHSLGSVVAHDHQVRQRYAGQHGALADTLLTYGSPIGLICWLWLLMDFDRMDFSAPRESPFFSWDPSGAPAEGAHLPKQQWINVVNHLDPIATAFPDTYAAMGLSPEQNAAWLQGGKVHHRYIRAGDGPGQAHTAYFNDRSLEHGFIEILARVCGVRLGPAQSVNNPEARGSLAGRGAGAHWREAQESLDLLQLRAWVCGMLLIGGYLGLTCLLLGNWVALALLPVYAIPQLTISVLAGFQRLLYSRPGKRIAVKDILTLRWRDTHSFAHRLRHRFRRDLNDADAEQAFVFGPGPGAVHRLTLRLLAFGPTLVGMSAPALLGWAWARTHDLSMPSNQISPGILVVCALALFMAYTIAFATSEIARHWRDAIRLATK